jgi:hypothetical protein
MPGIALQLAAAAPSLISALGSLTEFPMTIELGTVDGRRCGEAPQMFAARAGWRSERPRPPRRQASYR